MRFAHWRLAALLVLVSAAAACRPAFQLRRYTTDTALYQASLREFERRRWDNAVAGFERLTTTLPARDTLLPRSFWYLAKAQQGRREWLLGAQSFSRLVEGFPEDTLADDALLESARSYRRLWRKPTLDRQYGETALATYRQFLGLYPDSPLTTKATAELRDLEEWFAVKDYETGMQYVRRRMYDSAIIYFRDVMRLYPTAPTARRAGLRMVETYRRIRWNEEAKEVCTTLRRNYPADQEVRQACGDVTAALAPDR
ncbi:MAG: outer membrane protein assembly factor BamD [Gemmatimonadaceae bacterium]